MNTSRSTRAIHLLAAALVTGLASACTFDSPETGPDPVMQGFLEPPNPARPRVWWHWMNGNVTKEGIEKDLEWMKRVGLGGMQNFDASLGTPQVVEQRLVYMDPAWKDAFRFAAATADRLGLELTIAASPGWSETGGPWVPPAEGMKKLVWSGTRLPGGQRFEGKLAPPPAATGPFQDLEFHNPLAGVLEESAELPAHFQDVAVLAYPVTEQPLPPPRAESGSGQTLEAAALVDGSLESATELSLDQGDRLPTLVYAWEAPVTVRSATLYIHGGKPRFGESRWLPLLEAETENGWREVAQLPVTEVATTVSFDAVTARRFRLVLGPNDAPDPGLGEGVPGAETFNVFEQPPVDSVRIGQWTLASEARVNRAHVKAGYATVLDYYALGAGPANAAGPVSPDDVVDLTGNLAEDGRLDWTPPAGSDWQVLRLGWSLTGKTNHPATAEATGLEVDKYDGAAVRRYLETYLSMYRDAAGADLIGQRGLRGLLTDSIEVGASNWTGRMVERFTELRGYDPTPWLPALTGAVIGTPEQSDAFLYDFRRTLADLLVSEHYGTVAAVAHEHGMIIYGEALEDKRPVLGDDIAMRMHADVPMAALWTWNPGSAPRTTLLGDMKGAASVAHIYGQNLVAAESMTAANSPWAFAPRDLKKFIDLEFVYGVNRPVIHTSVHQPLDDKVPGLSLAIFGQYFNRHETWAEMARPWVDYMARTAFMLQQGRDASDVAYFIGDEAPITAQFAYAPPADLPMRYGYDFVNRDVLVNQLSVENGELAAKSGARYKALYLGGSSQRMTLATLRRIAELVDAGATVIGRRPLGSPSLADDADEFGNLADRLWPGGAPGPVSRGRVIDSGNVEHALAGIRLMPDFAYASEARDSEILFLHRKLQDGDAYFLTNRRNRPETIEARFRVTGRRPEIWRAITATVEPVSYRTEGVYTVVPLEMGAEDAFFVVFREPAAAESQSVLTAEEQTLGAVEGPWEVEFQPGRGAPASVEMPMLSPLDEHPDDGVRYFSGIATYRSAFMLPDGVEPGDPLRIDLGRIGDVAEVYVNGQEAGITWFPPYRLDIGQLVQAGENHLEVRVANLWVNRLIGDKQPGAEKITFVTAPTYKPDAPLRPSGLIGPVRLLSAGS